MAPREKAELGIRANSFRVLKLNAVMLYASNHSEHADLASPHKIRVRQVKFQHLHKEHVTSMLDIQIRNTLLKRLRCLDQNNEKLFFFLSRYAGFRENKKG